MNFRDELIKIKEEYRFSVESKANRFLMDSLAAIRRFPFCENQKFALFAVKKSIVLKIVDGPDIFSSWFKNPVEADIVFDLIVKKMKEDGCKITNPNNFRHSIIMEI